MSVELLFWAGCPSHPQALEDLREALRRAGRDPEAVELVEVSTDEDARRLRFCGSPTIRIDGRDVVDPGDEPYGLTCRIYRRRDGRISPTPDPEDLLEACATSAAGPGPRGSKDQSMWSFDLPDTDGTSHAPGGAPATVVVFTCNHCPYALAWHDRLVAVARDYAARGVKTLFVNPNDGERYPADSLEAMRERVARGELRGVPYLHDATQEVARAYGARTTPDVFVLDEQLALRYRGAPDADHGDEAEGARWLRGALDAVLDGREPDPAQSEPVGCSVKWRAAAP